MAEIKIDFKANIGQAQSSFQTMGDAISSLSDKMKELKKEGDLEGFANASTQYTRIQEAQRSIQTQIQQEERQAGRQLSAVQSIGTPLRGAENAINQANSGNAFGAMSSVGNMGLGVAQRGAQAIGGQTGNAIISAISGVAVVGAAASGLNALSEGYESLALSAMGLSATFDTLGMTTVGVDNALTKTGDIATKYGYNVEEGARIAKGLSRSGATESAIYGAADEAFAYERYHAMDRGGITKAQELSLRFGTGNALGYVNPLAGEGSGGMRDEYLSAMTSMLENSIERGFLQSSESIASGLSWIEKQGGANNPLFQGKYGAEMYSNMAGSISGAVSLGSNQDTLMWRAAKENLGAGASMHDIAMYISNPENTQAMSNQVIGNIKTGGGSLYEQTSTLMSLYNISYPEAEAMLRTGAIPETTEQDRIKAQATPTMLPGVSEQLDLIVEGAKFEKNIGMMGRGLQSPKAKALETVNQLIGGGSGGKQEAFTDALNNSTDIPLLDFNAQDAIEGHSGTYQRLATKKSMPGGKLTDTEQQTLSMIENFFSTERELAKDGWTQAEIKQMLNKLDSIDKHVQNTEVVAPTGLYSQMGR